MGPLMCLVRHATPCSGKESAAHAVQACNQAMRRSQHLIAPQQVCPAPVSAPTELLQLPTAHLTRDAPAEPAAMAGECKGQHQPTDCPSWMSGVNHVTMVWCVLPASCACSRQDPSPPVIARVQSQTLQVQCHF